MCTKINTYGRVFEQAWDTTTQRKAKEVKGFFSVNSLKITLPLSKFICLPHMRQSWPIKQNVG